MTIHATEAVMLFPTAHTCQEKIRTDAGIADWADLGCVISAGDDIARVIGAERAMSGEMLEFPGGLCGVALNLERDSVGVVLLGAGRGVKEGDVVRRTGRILSVPVGKALLGRVVNSLGHPARRPRPDRHV